MSTTVADLVGDLRAALGDDLLVTDPDLVGGYVRDQSRLTEHGTPLAVVAPRSTDDVAAALRWAHAHAVPVVTRGAGSGLVGGANAVDGGLVLTLHRMDRIVEVDVAGARAVVQPGVITGDLRAAVAAQGLFYPPDPGSVAFCSIGGNVATNAGGMCCVKYGVTGDYVLALEAVLPDGRVVRTGRLPVKGVAGYDLTSLLVGSEGTLAVVTEVTLRLLPAPTTPGTLVASFTGLTAAGAFVAEVAAAGITPSMLELMDSTTVTAVNAMAGMGLDEGVVLVLAQCDGPGATADLAVLETAAERHGAVDVAVSSDAEEAAMLLEARRIALTALERVAADTGRQWLLDDVAVPRERMVELVAAIERIAADHDLTIGVFGHAGDGNLHPTLLYTDETVALAAFDAITAAALAMGGTVTGEHGVGRLKRVWLGRELDPVADELHTGVKRVFDPTGILNPGVVR